MQDAPQLRSAFGAKHVLSGVAGFGLLWGGLRRRRLLPALAVGTVGMVLIYRSIRALVAARRQSLLLAGESAIPIPKRRAPEASRTKKASPARKRQEKPASPSDRDRRFGDGTRDLVDEASWESFPASDPPAFY